MKKLLTAILLGGCLWTACTEDNSTLPHLDISDIEIASFREGGYTIVSYSGNKLELVADVTSGYAESELTYTWYIIDNAKEANMMWSSGETYAQEKISEGKNLSFDVNLPPGTYTIVCEVKAANGYTVTEETTLYTTTDFATGHYILKETADGNTDVDVYNETDEKLIENVLTATLGQPMSGAPLMMSMSFDHCFINQSTNEMSSSNLMSVVTESGEYKSFNTTDMTVVLDRDNLLYYEMDADEYPYAIQSGAWTNYLFTNKGIRSQYNGATGGMSSGKYGVTAGEGASLFMTYSSSSWNVYYWDENTHSIVCCDYNGGYAPLNDMNTPTSGLTDYECIACGSNELVGVVYFLLENVSTGERILYLLAADFGGTSVETRILPADSHLAQSSLFSTSVSSSTYIYGLHDNVVYGYDMEQGIEEALSFTALPEGESITYVSNQCLSSNDYLVVGIQKGNDYTLYYYNVLGGKPDGNPVRTVNGKGKVKSMRYTKAGLDTYSTVPPYMD